MKRNVLIFIVVALLAAGCESRNFYTNAGYRELLMYSQTPKEVYGHWFPCGFLQFQRFERAIKDTIVILKFDQDDRFEFYGGISIGNNYERFENMKIFEFNGNTFFAVTARNSGNANGNMLYMFYIDGNNCTLHPVEIVHANDLYSKTLSKELFIWEDEMIRYEENSITSEFYIWRQTDVHSNPTGGKVSAIYDMEKCGKGKYRLFPKAMNFTEGEFEMDTLNQPFMIPLKVGANAPVRFETLLIEPVNLYVQEKPRNDNSPHIQLELNVTRGNRQYATFLWYYESDHPPVQTNFPKVFDEYIFSLEIDGENVALTVEKLDFGKEFCIDIRQKAVVGGLTITFDGSTTAQYVDPFGKYAGHDITYTMLLSAGSEHEEFYFNSLEKYDNNEFVFEWKEYQIIVLYDAERFLKLKIEKIVKQ